MKKSLPYFSVLLVLSGFFSCSGYSALTDTAPIARSYTFSELPVKGWRDLVIYAELDTSDRYEGIANIVVTGREGSTEEQLLKKIRKAASKYFPDAILHIETREVPRTSFDGFALMLNLVTAFSDDYHPDDDLEVGEDYYTLEVEAVAIRFINEEKP